MTDNVQITMTQDDYQAMFEKAQAFDWIENNCLIDYRQFTWERNVMDSQNVGPTAMSLTDFVAHMSEPDPEPDFGATTAGEVSDMAAKAYREGGR